MDINSKSLKNDERFLNRILLIITILCVLTIIIYSVLTITHEWHLIIILILLSFASLIVGIFLGTLFGMPKRNNVGENDYSLNNSLVEISEWLTKIIVGLGLVNLNRLPQYLTNLGEYVSTSSTANPESLKIVSICIVVFLSVFGILLGYNYMRLILSYKYKYADDNLLRKALENKQDQVNSLITMVNSSDIPAKIKTSRNFKHNQSQSKSSNINNLEIKATLKLSKGLSIYPGDPQRGQWGGKQINNNREIFAEVREIYHQLYEVIITIQSTDSINSPLMDEEVVLFALHPTFGDPPYRIVQVKNNKAELQLIVYGAFTVGAFVDHGNTELELNLAKLPNVPVHFKEN